MVMGVRYSSRELPSLDVLRFALYLDAGPSLDAGPLARCQCPEGPATEHLDTGVLSWFPCMLKANSEVVLKYPRCYYMNLM